MSPKAKKHPTKDGNTAQVLREAAAAYGIRRDVLGVREAKNQLSALLLRAARGEEIVITSDGQPRAMIVRYRPVVRGKPWKSLADFRATQPMQPDSAPLIDDTRADRM